jgi:hypothetical protein
MTARLLTLLSTTSLIVVFAGWTASAAEFATKEEAVTMVRKAVTLIKEQGPDKAYAEFTSKGGRFHDRDLYITVLDRPKGGPHRPSPDGRKGPRWQAVRERTDGASAPAALVLAELQVHEPCHQGGGAEADVLRTA